MIRITNRILGNMMITIAMIGVASVVGASSCCCSVLLMPRPPFLPHIFHNHSVEVREASYSNHSICLGSFGDMDEIKNPSKF